MPSVKRVSIGSNNGLSSIRIQAIIYTNFSEIRIEMQKIFIHENASVNIACEMAAILSREIWVKIRLNCFSTVKYYSTCFKHVYLTTSGKGLQLQALSYLYLK